MGILAMSAYYIQQKIKEIGIRKANGALSREVLAMVNRDFSRWIILSFVFAGPVAWYAINRWLENFPYRTDMSWWIYILSGGIVLTISIAMVSWQSWRIANKNPVEALRYE
jgi:putative ABC transport system permease protein